MQVGLLWFDNDPHRGLTAKVEDAARRYREKFGRPPNTCYVNSVVLGKSLETFVVQSLADQTLRVVPAANILPHHFWVGEEGEREA
jgi:hypothetical protein